MAAIRIDGDGHLRIDGAAAMMRVASTRIGGGGMSLDVVQPEGTSESEPVFDGWAVWTAQLKLELLEELEGARARYDALASLEALAREEQGEVPVEHSFAGHLARAMKIDRVLVTSLDPIEDSIDDDTLRVTMALLQVDPRLARALAQRRAQAAEAEQSAAQASETVDTSGEGWVDEEDEGRGEVIWGGE